MELHCPDCCSLEVHADPKAPLPEAMRCANCGERFEREDAYVTIRDAEERVLDVVAEEPFVLDRDLARAEVRDPDGALRAITPYSDADELDALLDAAQVKEAITRRHGRAWLHVYPLSIGEPDPLLVVDPGSGPALLGCERKLRRREEDPVAFTLRVLEEMVGEANALAAGRAADSERLDRIAAFLNRSGQWNGGDVCEFLAGEIAASGRRLLDDEG